MKVVVPYEKPAVERFDKLFADYKDLESKLTEALDLLRWYGKNLDLPPTVTQPALDFIARIEREMST